MSRLLRCARQALLTVKCLKTRLIRSLKQICLSKLLRLQCALAHRTVSPCRISSRSKLATKRFAYASRTNRCAVRGPLAKTRGQTHAGLGFQRLTRNSVKCTKLVGNRLCGNVPRALGRGSHCAGRGLNRTRTVVEVSANTRLGRLNLPGNIFSASPHKTGSFCLKRSRLRHDAANRGLCVTQRITGFLQVGLKAANSRRSQVARLDLQARHFRNHLARDCDASVSERLCGL